MQFGLALSIEQKRRRLNIDERINLTEENCHIHYVAVCLATRSDG